MTTQDTWNAADLQTGVMLAKAREAVERTSLALQLAHTRRQAKRTA